MKTWDKHQSKRKKKKCQPQEPLCHGYSGLWERYPWYWVLSCGVHTRIQKRILTHGNKGILRMQVNEPARATLLDY